jgi:superfamily II DNA/RNA helicase
MGFARFELSPSLFQAITALGYAEPTPIQAQAIPEALKGRDVRACAQTGTGKTCAFVSPIGENLITHAPSQRRSVLILTPTRELAAQIISVTHGLIKQTRIRTALVLGGASFSVQARELRANVDIVVATPGRLLDHIQQRTVSLRGVDTLVLDEADRMLDMGFLPDIKRILSAIPAQRQNLLFSATFSDDIRKLADELLNRPILIAVAPRNTAAETVSHQAYLVSGDDKRRTLAHLVKSRDLRQVLVFTRTRLGANRLARGLERDGIDATAIHSNRTQAEREKALADFKSGAVRVLVATDVASRGIDIEDLPIVVNYELPHSPEDYVHRIGRTGRAGSSGEAISLVEPEEYKQLADIEKLLKRKIPREELGLRRDDGMPAREPRPHGRERHGRGHADEHRPSGTAPRPPRPEPRAKAVADDGFDFSKPYEPANDTHAAPKPEAALQPAAKRRVRETAVLLGGSRSK